MTVEQLMSRDVKACRTDETLDRAAQLMWDNDCGCIPVVSTDGDGRVVGMITDRDIAMAAYMQGKPITAITVGSAMAREAICCHTSDGISQAEALMRDHKIRRLPVLDKAERLAGILSINDIAREARRETAAGLHVEVNEGDVAETLAEICQPRITHELTSAAL